MLGISHMRLYRYLAPDSTLRAAGKQQTTKGNPVTRTSRFYLSKNSLCKPEPLTDWQPLRTL